VTPMSLKVARLAIIATMAFGTASGRASADVVTQWNALALKVPSPVGPPQARALAMVHVAMHDAINSVTGEWPDLRPQDSGAGWRVPGGSRHRRRLRGAREYPSHGDS
jgi:hypothetical protein